MQEDVLVSWRRCDQLLTRLKEHMTQLQDLVGGRATVPKEQVRQRQRAGYSILCGLAYRDVETQRREAITEGCGGEVVLEKW